MTHRNLKIHPAMTAIAAVFAFSTPSFAQSTGEPIAVTSAPAIDVTSAPVAADSLAPAPVVDTPATADPLAPEAAAKPAVRKATTAKPSAARSRPATPRAASAAPAVATAPAATSVPATPSPFEPPPLEAEAVPVPAPIAQPPVTAGTTMKNPLIPIAGVAGLGLLALTGAGLVVRRRRRRAEDAEADARREYVEALPEADAEADPVMVVEPATPAMAAETAAVAAAVIAAHEPSPEIDGPVTELPDDFDVSQFGLHAQAAYNGPTEDNPSLSLKNRLSRANGMDQLAEREAEAEVAAATEEAPAAKPAVAKSASGDFMFGRGGMKPSQKPIVRPAHTH